MSDDEHAIDIENDDDTSQHYYNGVGDEANLDSTDKRAHHNALERKRRDHIKESFHTLRDSMPNMEGEKISRAQILNKATDFIKEMRGMTAVNEVEIDTMRKNITILEEKVKVVEEAKLAGNLDDGNMDTLLTEAERKAIEKFNTLSSSGPALGTSSRGGGLAAAAGGEIKSGITGTGQILNALTTSKGLSQLVGTVTPTSDHSYSSLGYGMGNSLHLKSPDLVKNNVRNSIAALTNTLRVGQPPTSTGLNVGAGASGGSTSRVAASVLTTKPAPMRKNVLSNGTKPHVITRAPPSGHALPHSPTAQVVSQQNALKSLTKVAVEGAKINSVSVAQAIKTAVHTPVVMEAKPVLSSKDTPTSEVPSSVTTTGSSSDSTSYVQKLISLSANPLELNNVLQNFLAANPSSSMNESQKTLLSTLITLSSTSSAGATPTPEKGGTTSCSTAKEVPVSTETATLNPQDLLNVSLKENVTEQEEQVLKEAHKRTPTEEEEEEQKIPLGKRAKFE